MSEQAKNWGDVHPSGGQQPAQKTSGDTALVEASTNGGGESSARQMVMDLWKAARDSKLDTLEILKKGLGPNPADGLGPAVKQHK